MTTDTTSTTRAPSFTEEASVDFMRAMHGALADARKAVLADFTSRLLGQTLSHPDMVGVLCTIKRVQVWHDDILSATCTFTNPETGLVEESEFTL